MDKSGQQRRAWLLGCGALGLVHALPGRHVWAAEGEVLTKHVGRAGIGLPLIGMGSSLTFDVGRDAAVRAVRADVLDTFFALGGRMVDSSPMYGSAEEVIGHCLSVGTGSEQLYSATKVWKYGAAAGIEAMAASRDLWGVKRFDLMQIHNMLDWEAHLETLLEMKAAGRIRHIGMTTSHGRRHADFEKAVVDSGDAFDFIQITYNVTHREAEKRLLPMARERGIGVIVNRPLDGGRLFRVTEGKSLPPWAEQIDCRNWAQVFLKYAVSHPAVTCAIPATRRVDHMQENMGAMRGALPDEALRKTIATHIADL